MARQSRPIGFDMTYRPTEEAYSAPLLVRLPSYLYLGLALAVLAVVIVGESSPSDTVLYQYVVESSAKRIIGARWLAGLLLLSAIAGLLRSGMRGVRIRADGLEYRDVVSAIWPQIRRYRWAQIDGVSLAEGGLIALELWDGSKAILPPVADPDRLAATLEKVALARAIPLRGGAGVDELPDDDEYQD